MKRFSLSAAIAVLGAALLLSGCGCLSPWRGCHYAGGSNHNYEKNKR